LGAAGGTATNRPPHITKDLWHTDFAGTPTLGTLLYALDIPPEGGDSSSIATWFLHGPDTFVDGFVDDLAIFGETMPKLLGAALETGGA
jgi:hypothetical protein